MVKYFIKQRKLAGEWKVVRCKYALPKKRKPSDFIKTDWKNYENHSLKGWRRYVDEWTIQEWLTMEQQDIAQGRKPMLGITKWAKDYEWKPPVAGEHFGTVMLPIGDHPFDPFQSDLEVEETTDDEEPGEDDGLKPTPSADRPSSSHSGAKIKLRIDDPKPWKLTSLVRSGIEKLVVNKRKDQDDSSSSSDRGSRKKKKKHDKHDDLETDVPRRKRSPKRRRTVDLGSDSDVAEQELLPLHGLMCVAGGGYQTTLWAHHSMGCVHKSMLRCA
jgi:hypothetical protein